MEEQIKALIEDIKKTQKEAEEKHTNNETTMKQNELNIEKLRGKIQQNRSMQASFSEGEPEYQEFSDEIKLLEQSIRELESQNRNLNNENMRIRNGKDSEEKSKYVEAAKENLKKKINDERRFLIKNRRMSKDDILKKIAELEKLQKVYESNVEASIRGIAIEEKVAEQTNSYGALEFMEKSYEKRKEECEYNLTKIQKYKDLLEIDDIFEEINKLDRKSKEIDKISLKNVDNIDMSIFETPEVKEPELEESEIEEPEIEEPEIEEPEIEELEIEEPEIEEPEIEELEIEEPEIEELEIEEPEIEEPEIEELEIEEPEIEEPEIEELEIEESNSDAKIKLEKLCDNVYEKFKQFYLERDVEPLFLTRLSSELGYWLDALKIRAEYIIDSNKPEKQELEDIFGKMKSFDVEVFAKSLLNKYYEIDKMSHRSNKGLNTLRLINEMERLGIEIPENPYEKSKEEDYKTTSDNSQHNSDKKDIDFEIPEISYENSDEEDIDFEIPKLHFGEPEEKDDNKGKDLKKITKIDISQPHNRINVFRKGKNEEYAKAEIYAEDIEYVVNAGNELIKNDYKNLSEKVVKGKVKGWLLRRKLNPAIMSILHDEGDLELLENYMESVKDKEKPDFEIIHDVSASKLKGKNLRTMNRVAKNEKKIDGITVRGLKEAKLPLLGKGKNRKLKKKPSTIKGKGKWSTKFIGKTAKTAMDTLKSAKRRTKDFFKSIAVKIADPILDVFELDDTNDFDKAFDEKYGDGKIIDSKYEILDSDDEREH